MSLSDVSIRRPVFAVMLIGGLVVLGGLSVPRLGVGLFPDIEFPMVSVMTRLEGASPETVEREVTQPLEEALGTIEGIHTLMSTSGESLSHVMVRFHLDKDAATKAQDVRDKVAAAVEQLPPDADAPVVERFDSGAAPILAVLLSGPQSIRSLTELADRRVKPRIERVSGVGNVTLVGGRKRELRIWLDPLRLSGHGLAVDDVLASLAREHVEIPGGRIATRDEEYVVRTSSRLHTPEQFGAIVVAERGGRRVELRDVATVEDGMAEERTVARLDGRRGVSLLVRRQSGANTVAVSAAVRRELHDLRAELPAGVDMVVTQDTSRFIELSIRDVRSNLVVGALLAVLVVFAFLRDGRSTVIAALAIPSSLVASFTFFYAFGFTLNNMTLMALSLSIGMLIDDAICVLENVYRHVERGRDPMQAAHTATREIGLAVVATTAALCAVFVPIAFMGGVVGKFFREFGLVVVCAVCTSTLVALTLTPMLCSRFLERSPRPGRLQPLWDALERGYVDLERRYRRLLERSLAHRPAVVGVALAATLGGCGIATLVPVDFVPPSDRSEFNVWLKLPPGAPLDRTREATARAEAAILRHPQVRRVFSTIGGDVQRRANEAELYVQIAPKDERRVTQAEVMDDVRSLVAELRPPVQEFAVEDIPWMSVRGQRNFMLGYSLRGPDAERLAAAATTLVARMREAGGYADLGTTWETGRPELVLEVERGRAADLGISAAQIGRTVSGLLSGFDAATFEDGGERYDVRVQLAPRWRDDPGELSLVKVRAPGGELVNLANLVTPHVRSGPVEVHREDRARAVTVFANLHGKAMGAADREVRRFIAELDLPSGYEAVPVGPTENMNESLHAVAFAFVLALVSIYMILASQFDSFVHPLTIMLCAPLSFIGAFAALWLSGQTLGMMSQIGFLMLMGLVMKNGILLVDFANTLRAEGLGLREAVLEAGPTRMRPVLMTTLSTVFGMVPMALASGNGAEWRSAMAVISIGGLTASMLLTLVVVPVAYTLVDDAREAVLGRLAGLTSRAAARPAPASLPEPPR